MKCIKLTLLATLILSIFLIILFKLHFPFFNKTTAVPPPPSSLRILMVGQKQIGQKQYTGSTLQKSSIDELLQRKLDNKFGKGNVTIINKLQEVANTSKILDSLAENLLKEKPNIVLISIGDENFKNLYGVAQYLSQKNTTSLFQRSLKKHTNEYLDYNLNEKAMYWLNQQIYLNELSDTETTNLENTLKRCISECRSLSLYTLKEIYFTLARIAIERKGDWKLGLYYFQKKLNLSSDFDLTVYKFLNKKIKNPALDPSIKATLRLALKITMKKYPGDKLYTKYLDLMFSDNVEQNLDTLSLNELIYIYKYYQDISPVTYAILQKMKYSTSKDNQQLVSFLITVINDNPLSPDSDQYFEELIKQMQLTQNQSTKKSIRLFFDNYKRLYPHSRYFVNQHMPELIEWFNYDLNMICDILKEQKIPFIFHGLSWRGKARSSDLRGEALKKIAIKNQVQYSDTDAYLSEKMKIRNNKSVSVAEKEEIIAEKIFEDILQVSNLGKY